MTIRAHYNGTVIVLDEPVDLPQNQPLELEWKVAGSQRAAPVDGNARRAALERVVARAVSVGLPDSALTREVIYADDDAG